MRSASILQRCFVAVVVVGASMAGAASVAAAPRARTYGSKLGMNFSINHNDTMQEATAYAPSGAAWVRIDANWSFIQRGDAPGTSDWADTDQMVHAVEDQGLRVLLVPTYTPKWAAPSDCYPRSDSPGHCLPVHPSDYANFVALAAQRYSPGGTEGTHVTAWEIWNEENGPFAGGPDPHAYTQLLQLAFPAIRAVNPTADVLVGGFNASPGSDKSMAAASFLRSMYHFGAHGSFTAVADHPYPGTSEPLDAAPNNAFQRAPQLHHIMTTNGDGALKVWATEIGYSSSTNTKYGVGPQGQATQLGDAITQWFKWSWTGPLFVYNLRDITTTDTGKFSTTGLLNCNYTPKPAWNEFVTLAGGTSNLTPITCPA